MPKSLSRSSRQFALLLQLKEHHKKQATDIGKILENLGRELFEMFSEDGATSFHLAAFVTGQDKPIFTDGKDRILTPETKLKPNVTVENHARFLMWMRRAGFDDLIKQTIHPTTLASWCTKRQEQNLELPPEELLKIFTIETAKIKRAPVRKV